MTDDVIRLREEISEQYRALNDLKQMAASYGFDISRPAANAQEAIQWLYFGYLGAIKSQNGAAMSIGRISAFLDIYIQRDLEAGLITEFEAQEMIDHLIMKLRMVKFARTPEYNQLFSGYPIWATLSIAGMGIDGRSLVTKNDFRILHTLTNMGPSPEPNLTVLYFLTYQKVSEHMQLKSRKKAHLSNLKTMTYYVKTGALTTVQSHVVFLQQLWVKICNSSALVRT